MQMTMIRMLAFFLYDGLPVDIGYIARGKHMNVQENERLAI